jgi:serpin B
MTRFLCLAVAVALAVSARAADDKPAAVEWSKDIEAAADGNNKFSLDLYAKLRDQKGNLFVSPYSVHAALGMTASGARGTTRDELLAALHLSKEGDKALAVGDMGRYYTAARKDVKLSVANAIWAAKGYNWRAEFRDIQQKRFGSGLKDADFVNENENTRRAINRWIEDATNARIKEMIPPGELPRNTTMILANAIYFKGTWKTQFDAKRTTDGPFHTADDKRIDAKFMYTNARCGYARFADVTLVELPYSGDELSMVVLLPKKPDGLPELEKNLTHDNLKKWLADLKDRGALEISLPKFKLETGFELVAPLQALGIKAAFGNADFTGMAEGDRDPITRVKHKAFVDVNEEGTEAAAATFGARVRSSYPAPFVADHPFLFIIRDAKKGTILFMGRVEKP